VNQIKEWICEFFFSHNKEYLGERMKANEVTFVIGAKNVLFACGNERLKSLPGLSFTSTLPQENRKIELGSL
jgi:hypothetical protein